MQDATNCSTARIRYLNDKFRQTLMGGRVLMTVEVKHLGASYVQQLIEQVRRYRSFDDSNDPYGEHDFGSIEFDGQHFFWKIDYYDLSLEYGSTDPANPDLTTRVLTLMLASEY